MARLGSALFAIGAMAALAACGGSDDGQSSRPIDGADWTLTITSPGHGERVTTRPEIEVAITGDAAARGGSPDFDLGFFVDDVLVRRGPETTVVLDVPIGPRVLRVEGIGPDDAVLPNVQGDEIRIDVMEGPDRELDVNIPPGADRPLSRRGRHGPVVPGIGPEPELPDIPDAPPPSL